MWEISLIIKSLWRNKVGPILIIIQLALSVLIVSNAIFFLQERLGRINQDSGIVHDQIAKIWVKQKPGEILTRDKIAIDILNLSNLPGIEKVAPVTQSIPYSHSGGSSGFSRYRHNNESYTYTPGSTIGTNHQALQTLGLSLISGRNFFPEEVQYHKQGQQPNTGSAIITQSLATTIFNQEDPINQTIYLSGILPLTVVGVVNDFVGYFPDTDFAQLNVLIGVIEETNSMNYVVRSETTNPNDVLPKMISTLQSTDNRRIVRDAQTMVSMIENHFSDDLAMVILLVIVILMLILVNTLGIVGLTTFWVNQRRKTIGIRRALGASRGEVLRYFLVENTLVVIASITLGAIMARWTSYHLTTQYGMPPLPMWYVFFAGITVLFVTLLSTWLPALRASWVPPREALSS